MPYLYEKIDGMREAGHVAALPPLIARNLNPGFELRPYQIAAFENFITYFEDETLRVRPTQTLFHMATGSGKTLIMAGLITYLYHKGYRDFLFFVNLSNIVRKTKDNFLNIASSKYLFASEIRIGGDLVPIKEVANFQFSDPNAINICFTTTQGLHSDLWMAKENALSLEDFAERRVVLISDEAHHLNAETLQGNLAKMSAEEKDSYHSWESTVKSIFASNRENVLLEFTATCDLKNPLLRESYQNKIIFDYPLRRFRADRYSKEIMSLQSNAKLLDRELQAVILSQYRLKLFQEYRIQMKPVVLFKSAKISESRQNQADFQAMIGCLTGDDVARMAASDSAVMKRAFSYFRKKKISFDQLAQELREDFGETHVISANDEGEAKEQQILLNSLEDHDNPYRAIFEVKRLDEGWDVLNLFDIVRLYETKESKSGKPASSTVSEAQLIGRGARYCPFQVSSEQPKYVRKYDEELEHPLRICEELYYHCQNSSQYLAELKTALREVGLELREDAARPRGKKPRQSFRDLALRESAPGKSTFEMPRRFSYVAKDGNTLEGNVFEDGQSEKVDSVRTYRFVITMAEIASLNYAIVQRATCRYPELRFDAIRRRHPKVRSLREFITDPAYLGNIELEINSGEKEPSPEVLFEACVDAFGQMEREMLR